MLGSVLLLAVLSAATVPSQQSFVITFMTTTFPYPFYYTTGSDIVVTCWLPPSTHTFQHWTHPTGEYISTTNGRYLITRDQFTVTLRVTNGQSSDGGSYTCHAMVGGESVTSSVSARFTLPIQVYSTSANATVNVGGSFNFSCNATDFIQRQWVFTSPFSRAIVVRSTTDGRITITKDFELLVTDAQFEDEGMYECRLVNNLGSIKLKSNVSVIALPEVFVENSYKEVMENSSVTLKCNVTGVPLPYIIWKDRSGQVLESSDELVVSNSTVSSSAVTGSLTFHQVRSHQTGPYTCCGINRYATSMTNINLRLHDTPEPPRNVMLELVNHTNIRVSWTAPLSSVDVYTIMYRALNGTSAGEFMARMVPSSAGTVAVLTDLDRLTQYIVMVYATNAHGASPNSNMEIKTTTATVPGPPTDVVVLDIGPTSLRVEWPTSSLPQDDGGAPLERVRITALREEGGLPVPDVNKTVDLDEGFAILLGLQDTTSYKIRVEFANRMGFGAGVLSISYQTPLPGAPGSPIHVRATQVTDSSVLVCWQDSASGQPFLKYKIELEEAGQERNQNFRRNADELGSYPNIVGCTKGIMVNNLKSESCYRFRVTAINRVGNGQPSYPSEEVCTSKAKCEGSECNPPGCQDGKDCVLNQAQQLGQRSLVVTIIAVAIPSVVIIILAAFVVTVVACIIARRAKQRKLQKSGECIPGIDRRASSNSTTRLLSTNGSLSSSFSSTSPNHSPDVALEQPSTAASLNSNVFEENLSKTTKDDATFFMPESPNFSVTVPHGTTHDMYYAPDGREMVLRMPQQGSYGKGFTSGGSAQLVFGNPPPSYSHSVDAVNSQPHVQQMDHEDVVLTDNPNYEEKNIPLMEERQFSNELCDSRSSIAPPVPPYYGGSMSDVPSEAMTTRFSHADVPFLGESYSQAGCSPSQMRRDGGRSDVKTAAVVGQNKNSRTSTGASLPNNEVELIENGAYGTVGVPKFEITGGEGRGAVREMVQIRKH